MNSLATDRKSIQEFTMQKAIMVIPTFLIFFAVACTSGVNLPFFADKNATPTAGIDFNVSIIYPTPTPAPVVVEVTVAAPIITPTIAVSATYSTAQAAALTSTLALAATQEAAAQPTPPPTATPPPVITQPEATAAVLTTTTAATQTDTVTEPAPPPQNSVPPAPIALLEPVQEFVLQPGINELEFKWRWTTAQSCQAPEGFGYELRIWPAVSGYGPMGVIDAVASQDKFYCDTNSNVVSYRVDNLKGTPGVSAVGAGKFLWDVVYIQLDPYTVMSSSGPQLFELP